MITLGRHILVELYGCSAATLNSVPLIEQAMRQAAQTAGATILHSFFHTFAPQGVSGMVVIQESHLAIHTWPEHGYAAIDIFTCGGTINPWDAYDFLKQTLGAEYGSAMEIHRGNLGNSSKK